MATQHELAENRRLHRQIDTLIRDKEQLERERNAYKSLLDSQDIILTDIELHRSIVEKYQNWFTFNAPWVNLVNQVIGWDPNTGVPTRLTVGQSEINMVLDAMQVFFSSIKKHHAERQLSTGQTSDNDV